MIPVHEKISALSQSLPTSQPPAALPHFDRLLSAAALVSAPLVAVALIVGKPWTAGSLLAGMVISLTVCGLLHLFVLRIMPFLVAGLQGRMDESVKNGAVVQFVAMIAVKFLILGLIGYAIINFHQVFLPAVLVGFALAQTAIVFTVSRHLKTQ
jgi:hypothetical protein